VYHVITAEATMMAAALSLFLAHEYAMSQRQQRPTMAVKRTSSLLRRHAYPVVKYRRGHTTPNTHDGGRNGTFAAELFKFGQRRLVAVMARPGIN